MITYVNEQFVEVSGYSEGELVGKSHNIIKSPETPPHIFEDLWNTIQQRRVWRGQLRNISKDGTPYYIYATIFPLVDTKGSIIEYIAIGNNITERVEIENRLKRQEKYSKMIFNNQKNIVFTATKESGIIEVNQKFLDTFGFNSVEAFKAVHNSICELFIEKEGYLKASTPNRHWSEPIFENPRIDPQGHLLRISMGLERIYSVPVNVWSLKDEEVMNSKLLQDFYGVGSMLEEIGQ